MDDRLFEWICKRVKGSKYKTLLRMLFDEPFIPNMDMDHNRILDGVKIRYEFGDDQNIPMDDIHDPLNQNCCSILEMMYGLSMRIEESMMSDSDYGDRTNMWFWMMVKSLELYTETNEDINTEYAQCRIDNFINRDYEPSGVGGLFTVKGTDKDMRDLEIWDQMCLFFDSIL